jgi:N-acetylmuramoyl-L-alanine amidase
LDKLYLDTRRYESQLLAETINTALYGTLSKVNPGIQNRGVRRAPFAVLVGTRMPAVLVEVSALSNQEDVKLLQDEQYRERAALAILRGINSYANNLSRTGSKDF